MSNVIVDKNKIDILANAISNKSGEPVTMTLDEMVTAVDNIETGIIPSGNLNITHAGRTDVTNYETVNVPSADYNLSSNTSFYWDNDTYRYTYIPTLDVDSKGWISEGYIEGYPYTVNAIPSGTKITPSESSQTFGGYGQVMGGSVTIDPIPVDYVGIGILRRSSSDVSVSGPNVSIPSGYYDSGVTKSVSIGVEGAPTATKVLGSDHSMSVYPSVVNTGGYITGGTHYGAAAIVTAAELASGNKNITSNGTNIDVVGYSTVSVNVVSPGGVTTIEDTLDASGGTIRTITTDTVINLTSLNATQNQTYTAPSGTAYNEVTVNVSGASSSGLEYEEGTWVQATSQNSVTINFTNTHSTPPSFYEIFLADSSHPADINSVLHIVYTNFEQLSNTTTKFYNSGGIAYNTYYGIIIRSYNTGSSTPTESMVLLTSSSSDASDSTIYNSRYWATETHILGFISSSRYFESGCTYYWRAVW